MDTIKKILERRPGKWPSYYDECNAKEYHEWFIKGTNIKLGFDYIDGDTGEYNWYRIITESYDDMIPYDSEESFMQDIKWMLMNKNLSWRYYE